MKDPWRRECLLGSAVPEGARDPLGLLRDDPPARSPRMLSKTISTSKLSELDGTCCLGRRSELLHFIQPQRILFVWSGDPISTPQAHSDCHDYSTEPAGGV